MSELKKCYVKEYVVESGVLKTISTEERTADEIGYQVAYQDKDKFKVDYLEGKLLFTVVPCTTDEAIMDLITSDIEFTGVRALANSTLLTGANPEDLTPAPKVTTSGIRMKSPDKTAVLVLPSELGKFLDEGYKITKQEMKKYPIVSKNDEVLFTINVSEINQYLLTGHRVDVVDVDHLVDSEELLALIGNGVPEGLVIHSLTITTDGSKPAIVGNIPEVTNTEWNSKPTI